MEPTTLCGFPLEGCGWLGRQLLWALYHMFCDWVVEWNVLGRCLAYKTTKGFRTLCSFRGCEVGSWAVPRA